MKKIAAICVGLTLVILLGPCLYLLLASFMSPQEVALYYGTEGSASLHFWPDIFSLDGYYEVLLRRPDYLVKFWNSLLFAGGIALGQAMLSSLEGFALACLRLPGRKAILFCCVLMMLMPMQVSLISTYALLDALSLLGTRIGLALSVLFTPFGAFLMTLCLKRVPSNIFEAAALDGAGPLRLFWNIGLPCAAPGFCTVLVLGFLDIWNMVEQPLLFLQHPSQYPLSLFLASNLEQNLPLCFVCGVLALAPALLLYLFFQDELVGGLREVHRTGGNYGT